MGPLRPASPGDEPADFGNQVRGHNHHGLAIRFECRFIFGDSLVLGLVLVVFQDFSDALLIPTARESLLRLAFVGLTGLVFHLALRRWRCSYCLLILPGSRRR